MAGDSMSSEISRTIARHLDRAMREVGVVTLLGAILTFCVVSLWLPVGTAGLVAGAFFGGAGLLEVIHRLDYLHVKERMQIQFDEDFFFRFLEKKPLMKSVIRRKIEYDGMIFTVIGLEGIPPPLFVTPPHCPRCQGFLVCYIKRGFFRKSRLEYQCLCGYKTVSAKTPDEIRIEIGHSVGVPK